MIRDAWSDDPDRTTRHGDTSPSPHPATWSLAAAGRQHEVDAIVRRMSREMRRHERRQLVRKWAGAAGIILVTWGTLLAGVLFLVNS